MAAIGDRTDAGVPGRADGPARELGGHEFRKSDAVAPKPDGRIELVRPSLEPAQPFQAVVRPSGLAELAVVDDVDAGLRLPRDDVSYGARKLLLVRVAVRGIAVLRSIQQCLGADQAAHMRRQDAMLAPFHSHFPNTRICTR